ncbi:MAG TPA: N-acetylmuramoyl-L-alanine amidase [Candidatus Acidoferrales bacterium]|nr:N-acetylmuramoyl-L-alanine amidase [Candidatus Acidoferrales bacterium]
MKRLVSLGALFATRLAFRIATAVALLVCLGVPSHADRKSDAREQFARAVKMRTTLEGYLEKDRTLANYKQTVAAYRKVYLISVTADEVTPSLIAEAELYQEMGRLFDPKYFKSSIDAYNFLLTQYPGSRYRGSAMLAVARIEKDDLGEPDDAEATYKEYLKLFPHSQNVGEAREGLKDIAAQRAPLASQVAENADNQPPPESGPHIEPRADDQKTASVREVRVWNAQNSTRIVVTLDDTVQYDAARIASPDRIYFDIYKAKLPPTVSAKPLDAGGLLKSIRIAPNKPGVVRLVLDVDGARDYSAFLVANPYRLVIDVRAANGTTARNAVLPSAPPAGTDAARTSDVVETEHPVALAHEPAAVGSPAAAASALAPPAHTKTLATATPKSASSLSKDSPASKATAPIPPTEPKPMRDGDRSLTRALGLKISRIVIDAGHGGHDTGTVGPHGLMEKDLCLDVAFRLGALIQQKLPGAEVIYTRRDDTFIPLEERTKIANEAKADLFISIHANSSPDPTARGVETYYLNFATSSESMEVAARENANSQESLHDLQDIIQKIARNEKVEESKELAGDIQGTLSQRLQLVSVSERNRGVKKAPFIVLIGANMPSVLSEISFVSNPYDERLLRKPEQRQRIAEGLYRGITNYLGNLNSLSNNKQKLISDNHPAETRIDIGAVAPTGNPK